YPDRSAAPILVHRYAAGSVCAAADGTVQREIVWINHGNSPCTIRRGDSTDSGDGGFLPCLVAVICGRDLDWGRRQRWRRRVRYRRDCHRWSANAEPHFIISGQRKTII